MHSLRGCIASLIILLNILSLALAASPTSFCKCTCFSNSTIIPLGPVPSAPHQTAPASENLLPRSPWDLSSRESADDKAGDKPPVSSTARHGSCNDCNRQFCLDYNLPICKGAKEADVFTTCFQRDSRKDEAVVFIFIIATAGLLIYAAIRPWVERWFENFRQRASYIPVANQGD